MRFGCAATCKSLYNAGFYLSFLLPGEAAGMSDCLQLEIWHSFMPAICLASYGWCRCLQSRLAWQSPNTAGTGCSCDFSWGRIPLQNKLGQVQVHGACLPANAGQLCRTVAWVKALCNNDTKRHAKAGNPVGTVTSESARKMHSTGASTLR